MLSSQFAAATSLLEIESSSPKPDLDHTVPPRAILFRMAHGVRHSTAHTITIRAKRLYCLAAVLANSTKPATSDVTITGARLGETSSAIPQIIPSATAEAA